VNKASVNVSGTDRPGETLDADPLTSPESALNVLEARCQSCGHVIPAHRVTHALRSKRPARWCRASCRVQASVARKRARLAAGNA
jgi:hypothetical protein